jgi:hypothetical protein
MTSRARTPRFLLALITSVAAAATVYGAATSRQQADVFARKVVDIHDHGEQARRRARRTTINETELNSWFTFRAQPLLPAGLVDPRITIVGNGKLLGSATIDLEAIGKQRSTGGTFDVFKFLGGRMPLSITGVLHTKNGQGRFELQAADVSGVPIPKTLLQELLSHYTRSEERPQGYRLEDPFALPANIRQIEVGQGQAVVVQ